MDQHRSHINEISRDVHVEFANLLYIREVLRGDPGDGDIVDVDILLANEVEQEVERPFVNRSDFHRKGEVALIALLRWLGARGGSRFGGIDDSPDLSLGPDFFAHPLLDVSCALVSGWYSCVSPMAL